MTGSESIAKEFHQAWMENSTAPDVCEFLKNANSEYVHASEEILAVVLIDQYMRWKNGKSVGLKRYLDQVPGVADDPTLRTRLILEEYGFWSDANGGKSVDAFVELYDEILTDADKSMLHKKPESWVNEVETQSLLRSNTEDILEPGTLTHPMCIPTRFGQLKERKIERESERLPDSIGRYRILKVIGKGGFGLVYLANDEQLDRNVAIKVPHASLVPEGQDVDQYLAEARTVAALDHPNIVPVHDVGQSIECPLFIVSKYVEGMNLAELIHQKSFPQDEAAHIVATIAEALSYAHDRGVIHRDIKPSNILIDKSGDAHLVDFGLALREKTFDDILLIAGTPEYMSPEQASGNISALDCRTDIYSLGVVFYELLTGQRTFSAAHPLELLSLIQTRHVVSPRHLNKSINDELERICLKSLCRDVEKRYSDAGDMAKELLDYLDCDALGWSVQNNREEPVTMMGSRLSFDTQGLIERDSRGNVIRRIPLEAIRSVEFKPGVNLASPVLASLFGCCAIVSFTWISWPIVSWIVTCILILAGLICGLVWRMYRLKLQVDQDEVIFKLYNMSTQIELFVSSLQSQLARMNSSDR